jgi:hypothetical protein
MKEAFLVFCYFYKQEDLFVSALHLGGRKWAHIG